MTLFKQFKYTSIQSTPKFLILMFRLPDYSKVVGYDEYVVREEATKAAVDGNWEHLQFCIKNFSCVKNQESWESQARIIGGVKGGWIDVLKVLEMNGMCRMDQQYGRDMLCIACCDMDKKEEKIIKDTAEKEMLKGKYRQTFQDFPMVVSFLINEKNVDVTSVISRKAGYTALHVASLKGSKEMVELLVKTGAGLDCRDNKQQTPLHLAAEYNNFDIVVTLLRLGADFLAEDYQQKTPMQVAMSHPNTKNHTVTIKKIMFASRSILLLYMVDQSIKNLPENTRKEFVSIMEERYQMDPDLIGMIWNTANTSTDTSTPLSIKHIKFDKMIEFVNKAFNKRVPR